MKFTGQQRSLALVSTVLAACSAPAEAEAVTPIQKVLEMLGDLLAKGKAEKHDEQVRFAAFKQWCDSEIDVTGKAIEEAQAKETQLNADIEKATATAETLGEEIADLEGSIATWETEKKNTISLRDSEKAEFDEAHQDLSESVDALERAIKTLEAKSADVPQALLQVRRAIAAASSSAVMSRSSRAAELPDEASRAAILLSSATSQAPEANAYEFQSGSVVEMLEKLRLKFQDEREALEKEEINKKSTSNLVLEKLENQITNGKDTVAEKSEGKARAEQEAAEAKADLQGTVASRKADEDYLLETKSECTNKAKDFDSRQKLRAEELVAIQKAIEIISSPEVAGTADKHLPAALVQFRKPGQKVLAQLRNGGKSQPVMQDKAKALLQRQAEAVGSQLLATVAAHIGEDPFTKVKKMIKDLIVKLMEEAEAEADHKGWCDHELETNKKTRDDKTAEVDDLTAQVESNTALEARLAKEIADLNEEVAAINKAVEEATALRTEEKATNEVTIAEAQAAQRAVVKAIEVLRTFYAKASSATAFAQRFQQRDSKTEKPDLGFDGAYKGMQSSSGGVVGMLEVVQSDFARLEAETTSSEAQAASEYEKFMETSETDKATKEKEARHKGFEKTRTTRALNQAKKDLEITQEELDAALNYYEKLKPSCVDSGRSYEERVQMRKEEIESLQEALKILSGEDI